MEQLYPRRTMPGVLADQRMGLRVLLGLLLGLELRGNPALAPQPSAKQEHVCCYATAKVDKRVPGIRLEREINW